MRRDYISPIALLLGILFCTSQLFGQTGTFENIVKANSYSAVVSNGNLAGDGLDFLMTASDGVQFFAIGEEHNVKEVPEITTMLFRALHQQYGYNHLALEQDPLACRIASRAPARGDLKAIAAFANRYPNAFTFNSDQELKMIADVGKLLTVKSDPVWGLDQVFGALHILERLIKFAPTEAARVRTLKLIDHAREYDSKRFEPGHHYMEADVAKPDDFYRLTELYRPRKGSEAKFLISQLLLSTRVYQNFYNGTKGKVPGYFENGREREENMKDLFMLEYREAQANGEALPKVLLKFGHWHIYRGMYRANVPTLGNFVSEFAKSNGLKSFQLAIFINNKQGGFRALAPDSWQKPLIDLTSEDKWTVIDLRPLRDYLRLDEIQANPELKQLILGFDAALVIGGVSPGTFALTESKKE